MTATSAAITSQVRNYDTVLEPYRAAYPWLVPGSPVVNQYYFYCVFYCVDEEFGPVCVKFSGYFPYTGRLILNRGGAAARIGGTPGRVRIDDGHR
jgi:hypothetical protein